MKPPKDTDIEEQLSIAYIHAVCARAAMCWKEQGRLADNNGIDGHITGWKPFSDTDGYLKQIGLHVQLKATKKKVTETPTHFSYAIDSIRQYDDLRESALGTARILVVLFLPSDSTEWLSHSHERLLLKKCAYWVSLRGAAAITRKPTGKSGVLSGATVYIPKGQPFNVEGIKKLASLLSHNTPPTYELPQK